MPRRDPKFQENDSNDGSSSGPISYISPTQLDLRLRSIREDYPAQAWQAMMNLMGSHDTNRVRFLLKKISGDNAATALTKWKLAGILAFTYPGAPTLYYGDEAGLAPDGVWDTTNSTWQDDPYNRAPYPWSDEGRTPDTALQDHFLKLAGAARPVPRAAHRRPDHSAHRRRQQDLRLLAYVGHVGPGGGSSQPRRSDAQRERGWSERGIQRHDAVRRDELPRRHLRLLHGHEWGYQQHRRGLALGCRWWSRVSLSPYQVSLGVADNDLAPGGSTGVTATVTDIGGQPVANGTVVSFTKLSGGGSLSAASATTTGGQASVTYTGPSSGRSVAPLRASSGSYAGAYDSVTVFTGYQADIVAQATQKLTIGPAYAGRDGWHHGLGAEAGAGRADGHGGENAGNPVGVPNNNVTQQNTAFVDLHLDATTGVAQLEVRVSCDGTCSGDEILWWFDAAAGKWKNWDVGLTGQTGGASGYVWGKVIAASTSPNFADLLGTVIMGGDCKPTLVEMGSFAATAQEGTSA